MKARALKTIAAGEFKAKCLQLMDEVAESGITLTITKRGKVVARLVPPEADVTVEPPFFGMTKGSIIYGDDLMEPLEFDWTFDEHNL